MEEVFGFCGCGAKHPVYAKDSLLTEQFINIETLKTSKKLKPGMVVETLGYYEVNDGGSAKYVIRDKKEDDVEDNGSIHFINNKLVAELVIDNEVNVKQFGAKGDGVTDDTQPIKKCFDKMENIIIPEGTYPTNEIILTKDYQVIKGIDKRVCILKALDDIEVDTLLNTSNAKYNSFSNFTLDGNKEKTTIKKSVLYCEKPNEQIYQTFDNIIATKGSNDNVYLRGLSGILSNITSNYSENNLFNIKGSDFRITRCTGMDNKNGDGFLLTGNNNTIHDIFIMFANLNKDYSTYGVKIDGDRNMISGIMTQDNLNGICILGNSNIVETQCDIIGDKNLSGTGDNNSTALQIEGDYNIVNATLSNCKYGIYKGITKYMYKILGNYNQLNYTRIYEHTSNGDLLESIIDGVDNIINGELYNNTSLQDAKYSSKYNKLTNLVVNGNFDDTTGPWEGGYRANTTKSNNIMIYEATGAYGGLCQKITTTAGKKYFCKLKGQVSKASREKRTILFKGDVSENGTDYTNKGKKYFTKTNTKEELYFIIDAVSEYSRLYVYTESLQGANKIDVTLYQMLMYEIPEDWYSFSADTINELVNYRKPNINYNFDCDFGGGLS